MNDKKLFDRLKVRRVARGHVLDPADDPAAGNVGVGP